MRQSELRVQNENVDAELCIEMRARLCYIITTLTIHWSMHSQAVAPGLGSFPRAAGSAGAGRSITDGASGALGADSCTERKRQRHLVRIR